MRLGCVYLIVNDFNKSIAFYEKLLEMPLTYENQGRFAQFDYNGHNISLMNGHFDADHPDKIIHIGERTDFNALQRTLAPNTQKFVLNFYSEDLRAEHERVKALNITDNLGKINYFCYVSPYYYFTLTDPDGNIIEVAGRYTPDEGEFDK
jgi:lactoylglutathione lyase